MGYLTAGDIKRELGWIFMQPDVSDELKYMEEGWYKRAYSYMRDVIDDALDPTTDDDKVIDLASVAEKCKPDDADSILFNSFMNTFSFGRQVSLLERDGAYLCCKGLVSMKFFIEKSFDYLLDNGYSKCLWYFTPLYRGLLDESIKHKDLFPDSKTLGMAEKFELICRDILREYENAKEYFEYDSEGQDYYKRLTAINIDPYEAFNKLSMDDFQFFVDGTIKIIRNQEIYEELVERRDLYEVESERDNGKAAGR